MKAREWWFCLTWYGEYSTPYHEGKHYAWKDDPDYEFTHVREVLPDEVTVKRELINKFLDLTEPGSVLTISCYLKDLEKLQELSLLRYKLREVLK